VKKINRYYNGEGKFCGDGILLDEENNIDNIFHPLQPHKRMDVRKLKKENLMETVMQNGKIIIDNRSVKEVSEYVKNRLSLLPDEHKRFENPHIYKVGISNKLCELRDNLIDIVTN
jgi:nicotinate phosphoribosyltransferase